VRAGGGMRAWDRGRVRGCAPARSLRSLAHARDARGMRV
jgi:hypothetical protein